MHTLKATIESLNTNHSAYINNLDGVVATGSTFTEVKDNLMEAINVFIETCKETGCELPKELQDDYRIEFKMDVRSLLSLYTGIFTKSGLERLTGINQKQLWHYANGNSVPRRAQVLKIEKALHNLGAELLSLHL